MKIKNGKSWVHVMSVMSENKAIRTKNNDASHASEIADQEKTNQKFAPIFQVQPLEAACICRSI